MMDVSGTFEQSHKGGYLKDGSLVSHHNMVQIILFSSTVLNERVTNFNAQNNLF